MANDYLKASFIANDPWVKNFCAADNPEKMANLIISRITEPEKFGPVLTTGFYGPNFQSQKEHPAEVIYDLIQDSAADFDCGRDAVALIMNKIAHSKVSYPLEVLDNIFFLIYSLQSEECTNDLFKWLVEHFSTTQIDIPTRKTLLEALQALAYCQKEQCEDIKKFWVSLWEQGNELWWNSAFLGIRYCDLDKALSFVPMLIERKCSNNTQLLDSLWRVDHDTRVAEFIKKGLRLEAAWAGIFVNTVIKGMKFAEKEKLINRLHEKYVSPSTEEEDHMETMGYSGR